MRQSTTPHAISLYGTYDVVVWWATPVEIASALARLQRMKELDSLDWAKATNVAKKLSRLWSVIQTSERVRATSIELVDRFDLRAADSVQLGATLE